MLEENNLSELIEEGYGTPENLAKQIDIGIEMLFYIEEETFEKRDIQNVVSAMRVICKVLRK
jgi:N-formylglutamate amidohydrolase